MQKKKETTKTPFPMKSVHAAALSQRGEKRRRKKRKQEPKKEQQNFGNLRATCDPTEKK